MRATPAAADADALRRVFGTLDRQLQHGDDAALAEAVRAVVATASAIPIAIAALTDRLLRAGRASAGADALAAAAAGRADDATLANNAAVVLLAAGRPAEAEPLLRAALRLQPEFHEARVNLSACLARTGGTAEAADLLATALAARGDSAPAWYNLGNLRLRLGRRGAAREAFAAALQRDPSHLGAAVRLLKLAKAELDFDAADALHARIDGVLADGSGVAADLSVATSIAYEALFRPFSPAAMPALRSITEKRLPPRAPPAAARRHAIIRLAYLSPNFGDHAVGHVTADLFAAHDRSRFAVHGFTWRSRADAAATRLRAGFDVFHDLDGAAPDALATAIAAAGIDILVDLDGLMDATAPAVLARRPAAVQVFWLGHAGGLGVPLADYLVADRIVIPEGEEALYAEAVARLPGCYHCASPHPVAAVPDRAALGLPPDAVVLAALHNPEKIDRAILERWLAVLRRTPGTVLWLADPFASAAMRTAVRDRAAAAGVAAERLLFADWTPQRADHLGRLAAADLFLDTITVNASSTALDALWAGVPVIAVAGDRFANRISQSMLAAAGLGDLVAADLDSYAELAAALARDPARRRVLRGRVATGRAALFDIRAFASRLEAAFATMVERRRRGLPPRGFTAGES
ncbi:MAG: tetratricopeptide repeat protein [Alphaproteobacteria bacterium]|nr:tetratricopeptide repeat protein [Alphaproteobacteria bacterium]